MKEKYYKFLEVCGLERIINKERDIVVSLHLGAYGSPSSITIGQVGTPPRGVIFIDSESSKIIGMSVFRYVNNSMKRIIIGSDARMIALKELLESIKEHTQHGKWHHL